MGRTCGSQKSAPANLIAREQRRELEEAEYRRKVKRVLGGEFESRVRGMLCMLMYMRITFLILI